MERVKKVIGVVIIETMLTAVFVGTVIAFAMS